MQVFHLAEDWRVEVDGNRCRFLLGDMLMGTGAVTALSAPSLRSLSDQCDQILPSVVPPAVGDLFGGV